MGKRVTSEPCGITSYCRLTLHHVSYGTPPRCGPFTLLGCRRHLKLPDCAGTVFNFCFGKSLRSGVDKAATVLVDSDNPETHVVDAFRAFASAAEPIAWDR